MRWHRAATTRACSRPKLQWRPLKPSGRTKGKDQAAACSNYAEMLDTRAAVGVVGALKGPVGTFKAHKRHRRGRNYKEILQTDAVVEPGGAFKARRNPPNCNLDPQQWIPAMPRMGARQPRTPTGAPQRGPRNAPGGLNSGQVSAKNGQEASRRRLRDDQVRNKSFPKCPWSACREYRA